MLSSLKSKLGASYSIIEELSNDKFEIAISVPLILEYEATLKKYLDRNIFADNDIEDFINYICKIGIGTKIYYLWRPILSNPYDDHILEVAVASEAKFIVTYNLKDFKKTRKFGIEAITPKDFLKIIGGN